MRIRSALNILREIKYMKSVIKRYGDRLSKGKYILFDGFRAMALNDSATLNRAHPYFDKPGIRPRMASIAAKLNKFGYYSNNNNKTTSEYEAFYTANNYDKVREVKLFSFKRNKILTVCTSAADAEKQIKQYNNFGNTYSMPTIKKSDYYPNSFEISMIKLKDFPGDSTALKTISQSTVNFNSSSDTLNRVLIKDLITCSYENEDINFHLKILIDQIDKSLLDIELPLCIQHGDLSKDNLLYGECDGTENFWWIDWEHARERVFFYDYFFYIINSALYYDNHAYDYYMSGCADENMKNFFAHFGLTFDPQKRRDYFLIFAVIFLKERVCDVGRVEALKMYCDFIATH